VGADNGEVHVVGWDGTLRWKENTGAGCFSSPVVAPQGRVYVGCKNGHLYAWPTERQLAVAPWPMFRRNLRHTGYDWSQLGGHLPGVAVLALHPNGANLYAAGSFSDGAAGCFGVARWDGAAWWSTPDVGLNSGFVAAYARAGNTAYVGGDWLSGEWPGRFAYFENDQWRLPSAGDANGAVRAVVGVHPDSSTDVYVGGEFTAFGETTFDHILRRQNGAWQPVPAGGLDGPVYALAADANGVVYAGGDFTHAGGTVCNHVARLTPAGWVPLSGGVNGTVRCLAVKQGGGGGLELYVGGDFTLAYNNGASLTAKGVVKWKEDENLWFTLGNGFDAPVCALAISPAGIVYAGGEFTASGTTSLDRVAVWTSPVWLPLGGGMPAPVRALAVCGPYLYAGGDFPAAGGAPAFGIARWLR
jgi:hypothetical protein